MFLDDSNGTIRITYSDYQEVVEMLRAIFEVLDENELQSAMVLSVLKRPKRRP